MVDKVDSTKYVNVYEYAKWDNNVETKTDREYANSLYDVKPEKSEGDIVCDEAIGVGMSAPIFTAMATLPGGKGNWHSLLKSKDMGDYLKDGKALAKGFNGFEDKFSYQKYLQEVQSNKGRLLEYGKDTYRGRINGYYKQYADAMKNVVHDEGALVRDAGLAKAQQVKALADAQRFAARYGMKLDEAGQKIVKNADGTLFKETYLTDNMKWHNKVTKWFGERKMPWQSEAYYERKLNSLIENVDKTKTAATEAASRVTAAAGDVAVAAERTLGKTLLQGAKEFAKPSNLFKAGKGAGGGLYMAFEIYKDVRTRIIPAFKQGKGGAQLLQSTVSLGAGAAGFAIGASIGTLIPVPVLGTVVGGVLGWAIGSLFRKTVDKIYPPVVDTNAKEKADEFIPTSTETKSKLSDAVIAGKAQKESSSGLLSIGLSLLDTVAGVENTSTDSLTLARDYNKYADYKNKREGKDVMSKYDLSKSEQASGEGNEQAGAAPNTNTQQPTSSNATPAAATPNTNTPASNSTPAAAATQEKPSVLSDSEKAFMASTSTSSTSSLPSYTGTSYPNTNSFKMPFMFSNPLNTSLQTPNLPVLST